MEIYFKYKVETVDVRGEEKRTSVTYPWVCGEFPSRKALVSTAFMFAGEILKKLKPTPSIVSIELTEVRMDLRKDETTVVKLEKQSENGTRKSKP